MTMLEGASFPCFKLLAAVHRDGTSAQQSRNEGFTLAIADLRHTTGIPSEKIHIVSLFLLPIAPEV